MKPHSPPAILLPIITSFFLLPAVGRAQAPAAPPATTLQVVGHPGTAPVIQHNGKSYVEVDALSRLIGGTMLLQSNRIIMTLPTPRLAQTSPTQGSTPPQAAPPEPKPGLSTDFVRAGIEAMTAIREWRAAVANSIQRGTPVSEDWVAGFRREADRQRLHAIAAASTDDDRKAAVYLQNVFNNMQQLSQFFIDRRRDLRYTRRDSLDNNTLDQRILACSHGLASLVASGHFEVIPSCQ